MSQTETSHISRNSSLLNVSSCLNGSEGCGLIPAFIFWRSATSHCFCHQNNSLTFNLLFLFLQNSGGEGGLVGGPLPDNQGALPKKVFAPRGDLPAAGRGDRRQAAQAHEVGVLRQMHRVRPALLTHDEEETPLQSMRKRKLTCP